MQYTLHLLFVWQRQWFFHHSATWSAKCRIMDFNSSKNVCKIEKFLSDFKIKLMEFRCLSPPITQIIGYNSKCVRERKTKRHTYLSKGKKTNQCNAYFYHLAIDFSGGTDFNSPFEFYFSVVNIVLLLLLLFLSLGNSISWNGIV